jgi:hypothetical protein
MNLNLRGLPGRMFSFLSLAGAGWLFAGLLLMLPSPALAQGAFGSQGSTGSESDEFAAAFAEQEQEEGEQAFAKGLEWSGFLDVEQGGHIGPDGAQTREIVLSNRLLRLQTSLHAGGASFLLKLDVLDDSVTGTREARIREGVIKLTPLDWMDIKAGKQVSTWGVGDLVFINDLFPKNWLGIFLGRDPEFWKDSANALRLSTYFGKWTWEVVYHPEFAPDTTPTGCRFSVFDPNSQTLVALPGRCAGPSPTSTPTGEFSDGEVSSRLKLQAGSYEWALYAYTGFFKSPRGVQWADAGGSPTGNLTPVPGAGDVLLVPFHPRLNVYGFSGEGQLGPGIVSVEAGFYDSKDDPDGTNPLIENSLWKYLAGYRLDWTANLATGVQWYRESMKEHDAYLGTRNPQSATAPREEDRDTYTLRVTLKFQQETLWVTLFHYERPQDKDRFSKLDLSKRLNDNLQLVFGVNVFDGEPGYEDREFGMLRNDDNAFARLRFNF